MTRNETQETIRNRRSIRGLIGPELSEKEIHSLIELAVLAPAPHHTHSHGDLLIIRKTNEIV